MREKPENFLSLVQIGITLVGTLGGRDRRHYRGDLRTSRCHGHSLPRRGIGDSPPSRRCHTAYLLTIVAGELLPKYIGINYRERAAMRILPLFELLSKILSVPVWVLNVSAGAITRLLGLKKIDEVIGEEEIKVLLEEGRLQGVFDRTEEEMIHSVFEFADRSAKEIMVPRPNVYAVDIEKTQDENVRYIVENQFSRYPVYRDHIDRILGIVHQKDVMRTLWVDKPLELEKILKRPYFVPDTIKISTLFKDMQKRHVQLAIVVDEYGTTVGIVTLEDIMEEIFGEIMDETDEEIRLERNKDGSTTVDGSYSVRDLNNALNLDLPESPDYETIGGFILSNIQGIARGGEIVRVGSYNLTVVGISGRRITKIKIEKAAGRAKA